MVVVTDLLTVARKINNYDIDATAGGLWTDTTHYKVTCPVGKRWFLIGGVVVRAVSATLEGYVKDSSDKIIGYLISETAAATSNMYPEYAFQVGNYIVLDVGEYVELVFGVAQNASSYASCMVLEVDV